MIHTIRSITIFLEVKPLPKQKPISTLIQFPSESQQLMKKDSPPNIQEADAAKHCASQQQLQNNHSRCAPSVDVTENNRTTMTTQLSAD
jgi:hypothetical protein